MSVSALAKSGDRPHASGNRGNSIPLNRGLQPSATRVISQLRIRLRRRRRRARSAPLYSPCRQALRLPGTAPDPSAPPCIRQRRRPRTRGPRQGVPARVRAPQRGAVAKGAGSGMGWGAVLRAGRGGRPVVLSRGIGPPFNIGSEHEDII